MSALSATHPGNAINPAEVEDIVALCETTALYRKRSKQTTDLSSPPKFWNGRWPA